MNEKLIIETLANLTDRTADLQIAMAGMSQLLVSRLPDLSQQQKELLKTDSDSLLKISETQKLAAKHLRQLEKNL